MANFPELPILNPSPARKSASEKYGSAFYLAIAGLAILVGLIATFGVQMWTMRSVWADVYVLNDVSREEADRIEAAWRLSRDPRVSDRQKWDLALSRTPPPLARYILAESLTAEAATVDPRAYALAVARSKGWPSWLRSLAARPLAYAAASGHRIDRPALVELARDGDRLVALWAEAALVMDEEPSVASAEVLRLGGARDAVGGDRRFIDHLIAAMCSTQPARREGLDAATRWLRDHHPEGATLWSGWTETGAGLRRAPAPELPGKSH